jgi:PIN domain nuclease of toxin-antitoxin system
VTTVVIDTHVILWWSTERHLVSERAAQTIANADELAVADISWWELAWLARRGRITVGVPLASWLDRLAKLVRTAPVTPRIAATAVALPATFPGDPADRLIYATAAENGWALVTKDAAMRRATDGPVDVVW